MGKINNRIYLKSSKIGSLHELFHFFVENTIFFKWTFFKNRPRSSYLLIRSILINTLVYAAYYMLFSHVKFLIMGIDVDPVLLFSGSTFLGYWVMSQSFHQKCNYLSTLYNDSIKADAQGKEREASMLKLNFSMQLLTMDLWGHRLYSWILAETLEEAASWAITHSKIEGEDLTSFTHKLNRGELSTGEVRNILLLRLQDHSHASTEGQEKVRHLKAV